VTGVLLFQGPCGRFRCWSSCPALANRGGDLAVELAWAAAKAVVLLALLLAGGQWMLRRWLTMVARRRSQETVHAETCC